MRYQHTLYILLIITVLLAACPPIDANLRKLQQTPPDATIVPNRFIVQLKDKLDNVSVASTSLAARNLIQDVKASDIPVAKIRTYESDIFRGISVEAATHEAAQELLEKLNKDERVSAIFPVTSISLPRPVAASRPRRAAAAAAGRKRASAATTTDTNAAGAGVDGLGLSYGAQSDGLISTPDPVTPTSEVYHKYVSQYSKFIDQSGGGPDSVSIAATDGSRITYPNVELPLGEGGEMVNFTPSQSWGVADYLTNVTTLRQQYGLTGKGIRIAIIDSGIDYTHPAFGGCTAVNSPAGTCRVVAGYDFVGDEFDLPTDTPQPKNDPRDCSDVRHGTSVAGVAAAGYVPGAPMIGVAPEAQLGAYKVYGCGGTGTSDALLAAIQRAVDDEMDIINLSLGEPSGHEAEPWISIMSAIFAKGILVVRTAGNDGSIEGGQGLFYADGHTAAGALVVGGINTAAADQQFIGPSAFSSLGPSPDLQLLPHVIGPAEQLITTFGDEKYTTWDRGSPLEPVSGTSFAAPYTAGSLALALQLHRRNVRGSYHSSIAALTHRGNKKRRQFNQHFVIDQIIRTAKQWDTNGLRNLESTAKQGAGSLNIAAVVTNPVITTPAVISLPSNFTIHRQKVFLYYTPQPGNNTLSSGPITYKITHEPAAAYELPAVRDGWGKIPLTPFDGTIWDRSASVRVNPEYVTFQPGDKRAVMVTFYLPTILKKKPLFYSGYIKLTPIDQVPQNLTAASSSSSSSSSSSNAAPVGAQLSPSIASDKDNNNSSSSSSSSSSKADSGSSSDLGQLSVVQQQQQQQQQGVEVEVLSTSSNSNNSTAAAAAGSSSSAWYVKTMPQTPRRSDPVPLLLWPAAAAAAASPAMPEPQELLAAAAAASDSPAAVLAAASMNIQPTYSQENISQQQEATAAAADAFDKNAPLPAAPTPEAAAAAAVAAADPPSRRMNRKTRMADNKQHDARHSSSPTNAAAIPEMNAPVMLPDGQPLDQMSPDESNALLPAAAAAAAAAATVQLTPASSSASDSTTDSPVHALLPAAAAAAGAAQPPMYIIPRPEVSLQQIPDSRQANSNATPPDDNIRDQDDVWSAHTQPPQMADQQGQQAVAAAAAAARIVNEAVNGVVGRRWLLESQNVTAGSDQPPGSRSGPDQVAINLDQDLESSILSSGYFISSYGPHGYQVDGLLDETAAAAAATAASSSSSSIGSDNVAAGYQLDGLIDLFFDTEGDNAAFDTDNSGPSRSNAQANRMRMGVSSSSMSRASSGASRPVRSVRSPLLPAAATAAATATAATSNARPKGLISEGVPHHRLTADGYPVKQINTVSRSVTAAAAAVTSVAAAAAAKPKGLISEGVPHHRLTADGVPVGNFNTRNIAVADVSSDKAAAAATEGTAAAAAAAGDVKSDVGVSSVDMMGLRDRIKAREADREIQRAARRADRDQDHDEQDKRRGESRVRGREENSSSSSSSGSSDGGNTSSDAKQGEDPNAPRLGTTNNSSSSSSTTSDSNATKDKTDIQPMPTKQINPHRVQAVPLAIPYQGIFGYSTSIPVAMPSGIRTNVFCYTPNTNNVLTGVAINPAMRVLESGCEKMSAAPNALYVPAAIEVPLSQIKEYPCALTFTLAPVLPVKRMRVELVDPRNGRASLGYIETLETPSYSRSPARTPYSYCMNWAGSYTDTNGVSTTVEVGGEYSMRVWLEAPVAVADREAGMEPRYEPVDIQGRFKVIDG